MKHIFIALLCITAIVSCKKDDGGSGGGTTGNSFVITGSSMVGIYTPGKALAGYITDSGVIAVPTSDTGLKFNYATIAMTTPWKDTLKTPNNTADYPSATYMQGFSQNILGQNLMLNQFFQLSTSSWLNLGSYTNGLSVTVPFSTYTASITVPAQASKQTPSQVLVNFPIAYQDSFNNSTSSVVTANASASIMGLPVTGDITTTRTTAVNSKNIAWGTLKLNGYTDSMKVIVQKYTTTEKTNITSTNALISSLIPQVLDSLKMPANGTPITQTSYRFWASRGLVMTLNANGSATVTTGL